jgi:preprotein translocase subunit YajC
LSIVIFLVLLVAMYAVLIVPQQRRVKAQRALLSALEEGDVVLTSAGIYGVITELSGDDLYLEVAEGIELKVTKASIAGKVRGDTDSADTANASETPAAKSESASDGESATSSKTPSIARGWRKGR